MGVVFCGLFLSVTLISVASASSPAAGSTCPHATSKPGGASITQLRKATLCLINKARADRGVGELTLNSDLTRMAKHHTRTMLVLNCLKHRCTGELSLAKRVKNSGYTDGATKWSFAEDIGYESTPRQMVNRWLSTNLDERNLLNGAYEDVGIGPGAGAADPGVDDSGFVTYTIDLGSRKLAK